MSERLTAEREKIIRNNLRVLYPAAQHLVDFILAELDALRAERDELDASLRYAKATIDVVTQQRDEARRELETSRRYLSGLGRDA